MTKAEQALLAQTIADLKTGFQTALDAALAPLVSEVIELQQRSSNFAARVNASNKVYRGEIARLRDMVEALTPVKVVAAQRTSPADWDWAMAQLRKQHPGKTFFAPGLVRATAEARAYQTEVMVDYDAAVAVEDEEVSL